MILVRKITTFLFFSSLSCSIFGNELYTNSWNFSSPDAQLVKQNRLLIRCNAAPSNCPAGLSSSAGIGQSSRSDSGLYNPSATSTANNTSVVVAGSGNDIYLTTVQSADDSAISSDLEGDATIDNNEVSTVITNID